MTRWTVRLVGMPDGRWFLPIPPEVLALAHLQSGDEVEVTVTPSGALVLARPAARTEAER